MSPNSHLLQNPRNGMACSRVERVDLLPRQIPNRLPWHTGKRVYPVYPGTNLASLATRQAAGGGSAPDSRANYLDLREVEIRAPTVRDHPWSVLTQATIRARDPRGSAGVKATERLLESDSNSGAPEPRRGGEPPTLCLEDLGVENLNASSSVAFGGKLF